MTESEEVQGHPIFSLFFLLYSITECKSDRKKCAREREGEGSTAEQTIEMSCQHHQRMKGWRRGSIGE